MRILLGIAGLTMLWFFCGTSSAQPMPLVPRRSSVTGHGETVDSAKKDAVNKAIEYVSTAASSQSFVITEEYLRKNVLVDAGTPGKDVQVDNIRDPFKAWVLTFRTDTNWWSEIANRDHEAQRKLRADDRQKVGSLVVIGLAFLLLVGFGYVRLDEYTQRRYTTWLRLASVGVASTVVAGWWWWVVVSAG